jgi:tetratricopeptide (TPR) repeat protein
MLSGRVVFAGGPRRPAAASEPRAAPFRALLRWLIFLMAFDKAKAIRAAEKHLAQGKIPAAIQEYQRVVSNDPEDFSTLNTLGDLHARVNQKREAVACYRRVAEHYREQGFALKAVAMYKKVTRIEAGDPRVALALASLYEQQGLSADARAQYLSAADWFTRSGDGHEALKALGRVADLDPSDIEVRVRLAEGYARRNMADEAAEAYIVAGERLAARGEHRRALDIFKQALALNPTLPAALSGALGAHVALGTAADAASILEPAVAESPRDVELRAMLARARLEAGDAPRADQATEELVRLDSASYTVFFDVARLYLRQREAGEAARVLGRVSEQALAGRQDETLLELLQEVLTQDPEQLAALRLIVRVYAWQREDERLRMALELLSDAARAADDEEEERRALGQLVRLAPDEPRYAARLDALGGHADAEAPAPDPRGQEAPTFESFMLQDEGFGAAGNEAETETEAAVTPAAEFEWNAAGPAVDAAETDPSAVAAFAFEGNEADAAGGVIAQDSGASAAGEDASHASFQEIDFGAAAAPQPAPDAEVAQRMLLQELESVDFYLEQGYADIARETLDMLERQYGPHAEVERRRALLPADAGSAGPSVAGAAIASGGDAQAFDFTSLAPPETADESAARSNGRAPSGEISAETAAEPLHEPAPEVAGVAGQGIDPGLAAIFDEFRESVEEGEAEGGEDFETHYQMGLAYREMGLLDQAVEEFQLAAGLCAPGDGTPRYLNCCNLLGHCFIQKGMPRPAAVWFRKGLDAPGHGEDEYQALRYELGAAYEQMGETERAVETFSEVYAMDVSYRGVAERLRELQKTVNRES